MSYWSRRADLLSDDDVDYLRDLHDITFGDSASMVDWEENTGAWWLTFKRGLPEPVAFIGVQPAYFSPGCGYFSRVGVEPLHRGHGLQRRLQRLIETYARNQGWHTIVTDTTDNIPSANNIIRAGYLLFTPQQPWGFAQTLYWQKQLMLPANRAHPRPQS